MQTIALDHHATTPCAPEVVAAMEPYLADIPYNAHSLHAGGRLARDAVERARYMVADLIGATPGEIVFTSGATEANNIALLGTARAAQAADTARRRILTSAIEHKCVTEAARHLGRSGFDHQVLPVGRDGIVDLERLREACDADLLLVSVMAANNEIGTVQPIAEIAEAARISGAIVHSDLAQMAGKLEFDVVDSGCHLASLSAHKIYGPKGIGALYLSSAAPLRPLPIQFGGGQEDGLRPGTLPVAAIVGFGAAADLCRLRWRQDAALLRMLADTFLQRLRELGVAFSLNGSADRRLPGSVNLCLSGTDSSAVLESLDDRLLVSSGSACQAKNRGSSHVLTALGLDAAEIAGSIRLGFGRGNGLADAIMAADLLSDVLTCKLGKVPFAGRLPPIRPTQMRYADPRY